MITWNEKRVWFVSVIIQVRWRQLHLEMFWLCCCWFVQFQYMCEGWLVEQRRCICLLMARMSSCFEQALGRGGGICPSRPIREANGVGHRMAEGGRAWGLRLWPHPPPLSGDYLIGGRKVGGNGGVRGVRIGTQVPSVHLEGKRSGRHHTAVEWSFTWSRERGNVMPLCARRRACRRDDGWHISCTDSTIYQSSPEKKKKEKKRKRDWSSSAVTPVELPSY